MILFFSIIPIKEITFAVDSYQSLLLRCPKDRFGVEQYIWKSRCHDGIEECQDGFDERNDFTACQNTDKGFAITTTKTTTSITTTTTTTTTKTTSQGLIFLPV